MQIIINAPTVMSSAGCPQETVNGYTVTTECLPELTGSENQVKWANEIRAAAIDDFALYGLSRVKDADGVVLAKAQWRTAAWQAALEKLNDRLAGYADRLAAITSAKDWIEAANGQKDAATIMALLR